MLFFFVLFDKLKNYFTNICWSDSDENICQVDERISTCVNNICSSVLFCYLSQFALGPSLMMFSGSAVLSQHADWLWGKSITPQPCSFEEPVFTLIFFFMYRKNF